MLTAARTLSGDSAGPAGDVYFVCTVKEEIGGVGGVFASRTLPGTVTLALEVGPTEAEYATSVCGGPIIAYSDAQGTYDKSIADRLMDIGEELGLQPQPAVLGAFESDASHAAASGLAARSALLSLPTLSTHGYEVIRTCAIPNMSDVLVEFLLRPGVQPGSPTRP